MGNDKSKNVEDFQPEKNVDKEVNVMKEPNSISAEKGNRDSPHLHDLIEFFKCLNDLCCDVKIFLDGKILSPVKKVDKEVRKKIEKQLKIIGEVHAIAAKYHSLSETSNDERSKMRVNERNLSTNLFNLCHEVYKSREPYKTYCPFLGVALRIIDLKIRGDELLNFKQDVPNSLNLKAAILLKMGNKKKALVVFQSAKEAFEKKGSNGRRGIAVCANNIGVIFMHFKMYEKAEETFIESISVYKKMGSQKGEGETLNNLGDLYRKQWKFPRAISIYDRALKIKIKLKKRFGEAFTLQKMGYCRFRMKERFKDLEKSKEVYNTIEKGHYRGKEITKYVGLFKEKKERLLFIVDFRNSFKLCFFSFAKSLEESHKIKMKIKLESERNQKL